MLRVCQRLLCKDRWLRDLEFGSSAGAGAECMQILCGRQVLSRSQGHGSSGLPCWPISLQLLIAAIPAMAGRAPGVSVLG